jgi:anaerobic selenocysteine-containing dehydrogenase
MSVWALVVMAFVNMIWGAAYPITKPALLDMPPISFAFWRFVVALTVLIPLAPRATWVLITGRQLEHWHTGSMTRRATVLDALEPAATASMHPTDMDRLGLQAGQRIRVASRRGHVDLVLRQDNGTPLGTVFMPFAYVEAEANELTNAALDPFGKIPEFKYCAVRVESAITA